MAFQMSTALSSIAVEKAPDGDFEESYDAIERERFSKYIFLFTQRLKDCVIVRGSYGDHSSSATASKRSTRTSVEYEDQRLYEILADVSLP